ncbi:MAG: hypothetical protein AB1610_07805 [Nitrospirota bacterium]
MLKKLMLVTIFIAILFARGLPAIAEETSAEVEQLKGEVQKLQDRIEGLEKKQTEVEAKGTETEKSEKKSLKDRLKLTGEARFRIMSDTASTDAGFYGDNHPSDDREYRDETSFPLRVRLNLSAEVVPDIVDFYARLTMNKRWGSYDTSATDPFDKPNSFESSIGHDMSPRFEQAYTTIKMSSFNTTWYIGRLPGMDGPPSRQDRSLFPRLFIDSEIDGTLLKWDAPETFLDKADLPWTETRLWGEKSETAPVLKGYKTKVQDKTGIILGYLKYDERKLQNTDSGVDDADAYLAQAQLKVGKDSVIVMDGLYMYNWHMPNSSDYEGIIEDIETPYGLAGLYADTQLLGFQIYGAYYYSYFEIPEHSWEDDGTTYTYEGDDFSGHIWYVGFNTGDMITPNQQLCIEFAKGSDAWINPFNYRGYRRKGTVLYPANNYFYDSDGTNTVVGFYPFNAEVWDIYYSYYYNPKTCFRIGFMAFDYSKHDSEILGSSKYQNNSWPYFEVSVSF